MEQHERGGMAAPMIFTAALADGMGANVSIRRIKAGETLYVEGETADYCYEIVSGAVKEYNTLEDGRRQVAEFYSAGDMFGFSESADQLHTAEAITPCAVRCYPREAFMKTVAASPSLSASFLETLMTRLHRARERMVMIGRMSAIQRVATFLLRLTGDQDSLENAPPIQIHLAMSRQDIADHLGLTIETVCRTLTELKKKKVIVMESARVFEIADLESLEAVAMGSRARLH
ncbi:helix-turn-helix domain-containing protein [Hyphococcus sp.]|jgi:CRP-like cAMP-binding protein|uniref:helix-turn-helix domain-containing protein n=1 Tax=Hyphococcus sp. TaxID=2038636 RepID=UPI003D11AE5F